MRKNIFLHFLNRDTREIFRLYELFGTEKHARNLREPLNAAAILCEEFCVAPPGFVVEDKFAFELFEVQSAYLAEGLVRLPMRESNLLDFAEKKRGEYAPNRNRYSGLYDDSRMLLLSSHGQALVQRRVQIGPAIVKGFLIGVDTRSSAWARIRNEAMPEVIENMRKVPEHLADEGKALTWSIIEPNLIESGKPFWGEMRNGLQYTYFGQYCREFSAIVMSDIPYMPDIFYLPNDRAVYSMRRFRVFLDAIHAADLFLQASADVITNLRSRPGFTEFVDAYAGLAAIFKGDTDLQFHAARAAEKATYPWRRIPQRFDSSLADPTDIEIYEISDACREFAAILTVTHGLPTRYDRSNPLFSAPGTRVSTTSKKGKPLKIALFVALEEELKVLVRHYRLKRSAEGPAATGKIGEIEVDVLCPRAMGRVAAAVEVTGYLAKGNKPDLLFCIGLAGGVKESGIEHGAVICVDTVVDLANRKVTDDAEGAAQSKFRRQDFSCSKAVYSIAKSAEFEEKDWANFCIEEFEWKTGRMPSIREGKIASVDEVVASDDHRKKMVDSVDKLMGVEMEAGGVCAAASQYKVNVVVIRVVSDLADPSKADDEWRKVGMKTLAELLKRLPLNRVIEVANR
ncbi:hypothetical protein E0H68_03370 [Rhizobium leguminosarum bv. viciae]|uniref:5'-methylthioadenosine/S-adenosylhomocysteine nucleosidase family protein n=1 Tax=Rhizobium leguminosarum TaxID=384 RepID=UPI00104054EE|nr:hypothetical protein [Rhizobium leguminosarum]TCA18489.1 hypothetical protein E0H68_03370 [Rhizobium leguminosarum bv. viciae]